MTPEMLRQRAASLRAHVPRVYQSNSRPPAQSVKLSKPTGAVRLRAEPTAKPRVVTQAIEYAKYLGRPKGSAVFLVRDNEGRAFYQKLMQEQRALDEYRGVKRGSDGARLEVLNRLIRMPGGVVKLTAAGSMKLVRPIQKFLDGGVRVVRGYASTVDVDRQGDVVVPAGMKASLPVPLLFAHDHKMPIGVVRSAQIRPEGIWIEASLATGVPKADEIWALVSQGALDSFSVGFQGKGKSIAGGGLQFDSWTLLEVSIVAVPANASAKIRRSL